MLAWNEAKMRADFDGKLAGITNELRNSVAGFTLPDEGRGSGRVR